MKLEIYLILSAFLFVVGLLIMITKRNIIFLLMGVELILNAANMNLVAFSRFDERAEGQMFALFLIMVAAAESAVALAIVLQVVKVYKTSDLDQINKLKG